MTVLPSPVQHRHHPYHLLGKTPYKMDVLFLSLLSLFQLDCLHPITQAEQLLSDLNLFKARLLLSLQSRLEAQSPSFLLEQKV